MKRRFTFVLLIMTIYLANSQEFRYVNASELNVREGAGKNYNVITKVYKNEKVTVISEEEKWSVIETENGTKGFVSTKFLSNSTSESNGISNIGDIILKIFVYGFLFFLIYKLRNVIYAIFGPRKGNSSSSQRQNHNKKQELNKSSRNNAVFRYRIKGNGTAGGVKYVDGMNIEVAVSGIGAESPFNNMVEKLFIQEFARKYNIEPRFHTGIKMLYNRQYLDVEIL
jgi:hypothetical protein